MREYKWKDAEDKENMNKACLSIIDNIYKSASVMLGT